MKRNKNTQWTTEDVLNSESDFWLFDDEEIENYYFESFMLKHIKKVALFDYFLMFSFVIYVCIDLLITYY